MRTWINVFIKFWWFLQGIILLVFGFFVWIPISVTGILVLFATVCMTIAIIRFAYYLESC